MNGKFIVKTLAMVAGLSALGIGQPILKTGPCPTLSRYTAPSGENWAGYPVKPQPTSSYPTGTIQNPLPPQLSINCVQVPPGLRPEIVASELTPGPAPAPGYLMHFTFDERGRLWALDVRDYPYFHDTTGMPDLPGWTSSNNIGLPTNRLTGRSRVLIFEDSNGDGAMDSYKVFYPSLALPTSIEVVNGGVIVTVAPNIYFIPKSNTNPDTAGTPVVLFSGMGTSAQSFDTHGQINSLTTGLDNWYYGHTGYNGSCTVSGANCGNGQLWRFRHTGIGGPTTTFQAWTTGPSNAHGIGQMEDGQFFQAGATGTSHNNHSLRRAACCGTSQASISVEVSRTYYPITGDRYLWEGSTSGGPSNFTSTSTAASGHDFYTARLLPQKYWNRFSFVCEGASKLCNQDSMVLNNSTWRAERMTGGIRSNIFASTDAWVAPLKVRTGPDGGLWVVDWYNYLFLHNPNTPATNSAWRNHLRYKTRTRMYRILPEDGSTQPVLNLASASTQELVAALGHSNFLWRMQAQRLLIGRGYTAELGDLLENILTTNKNEDAVGINGAVLHAVWTLEGLGRFTADASRWNPVLKSLLLHPAWTVRRNVLLAMPRTAISAQAIKDQCAADDPHAHVRIQAYLALAESPAAPSGVVEGRYRATDTYSQAAFDAAGSSKLVTATPTNTRPPTCPDIQTAVAIHSLGDGNAPQARHQLRFNVTGNGFELSAQHGQLASGELVVYDLRGQTAFRSTYNAARGEWSRKTATGLNMSVYFYSFRAIDGDKFDGRIFLNQDL